MSKMAHYVFQLASFPGSPGMQIGIKSEIETPRLKYVLRNGFKYFMQSTCSSLAYSPDILVVSTVMNMVSVLSISTELHSST